jgi:NADH:ubiquinone oxidoreductase subunit
MSILSEIFCWWHGNTWGTRWTLMGARAVGADDYGNRYFEQRSNRRLADTPAGRPRRYVIYKDMSEASQVPAEWHGWLHYMVDTPPTDERYEAKPWQKGHKANLTGTAGAYRPSGSILGTAERPKATGDYKPWRPV